MTDAPPSTISEEPRMSVRFKTASREIRPVAA